MKKLWLVFKFTFLIFGSTVLLFTLKNHDHYMTTRKNRPQITSCDEKLYFTNSNIIPSITDHTRKLPRMKMTSYYPDGRLTQCRIPKGPV